jgi:hypothetical protein
MPRLFHPKRDVEAQNASKDGFPRAVKRARQAAARRGRRLRIMFADEARFRTDDPATAMLGLAKRRGPARRRLPTKVRRAALAGITVPEELDDTALEHRLLARQPSATPFSSICAKLIP